MTEAYIDLSGLTSYDYDDKYLQGENAIRAIVGQTVKSYHKDDDVIAFQLTDGRRFALYHNQDCCESVTIEDIIGDLGDLCGTPILLAEQRVSENAPNGFAPEYHPESQTWTYYTFRTIKGTVDMRWFGSSNGYYSESVSVSMDKHQNGQIEQDGDRVIRFEYTVGKDD